MEIEAKFALTEPVSAKRVESLDWGAFQLGQLQLEDQHNTFFDTPDLDLSRSGYAVRLRSGGTTPVVTIKGMGSVAEGVHSREEWEEPTSDPDPGGWPTMIRRKLNDLIDIQTIQPLLTIDNRRYSWKLLRGDQLIGEVALDKGTIDAGGEQEPLHELEIELKGGTLGDLAALGVLIRQQLPARPEDRSKFERGLALVRQARSTAQPERAGQRLPAKSEQSDG